MSSSKSSDSSIDIQKRANKGAEIIYITRPKNELPSKKIIDLTNCILFDRQEQSDTIKEIYIRHPYTSKKFTIVYDDGEFLDVAKKVWEDDAMDRIHPTATVIVKNNKIIGKAGNGLTYHTVENCERKKLGVPTGQGYHLCDGTHLPKNHSEPKAVRDTIANGNKALLKGATAYLYGHWWSCDCSIAFEETGVKHLVISKSWTREFLGV